jgi:hypothetical protein
MPNRARSSTTLHVSSAALTRRAAVALLLTLVPVAVARAADQPPEFRVIAHVGIPGSSVDRAFVADVFLKNVTRWPNDEMARPVDQRPDTDARRKFSESVLRRSVAAVKTYWQQRIFSGRGVPPAELDSDEAVVRYVEAHPGAIGYISGAAPHGKTKVLTVTP